MKVRFKEAFLKNSFIYRLASKKWNGFQFKPLNRWNLFFQPGSRYLHIPQTITLASFYPLHKKSRRSQSLNELYKHFCEFQIFEVHFLVHTKKSERPRMVKMGLFASTFSSDGRYSPFLTLVVYLPHPTALHHPFTQYHLA